MPCSICGRAEGASTPPCPHCPPDQQKDANNAVLVPTEAPPSAASATAAQDGAVDPEILPPEDGRGAHRGSFDAQNIFTHAQRGSQSEGSTSSFRFAVWHGARPGGSGGAGGFGGPGAFGGMGMGRSSCLPGCITLFLTLVCTVQFGVLAALGFVVFHLIGSGAVLALNLQQIMQGRRAYWGLNFGSWLGRIVVWAASWALVGWLSDGF